MSVSLDSLYRWQVQIFVYCSRQIVQRRAPTQICECIQLSVYVKYYVYFVSLLLMLKYNK